MRFFSTEEPNELFKIVTILRELLSKVKLSRFCGAMGLIPGIGNFHELLFHVYAKKMSDALS